MMKKLMLFCLLLVSTVTYSQKYYGCIGPSLTTNTHLSDTKNLLSGCIEVGKYLNNGMSVGIRTGLYTTSLQDVYTDLTVSAPIGNSNFSATVCGGYFYNYQDITLEYDINYGIKLPKNYSIAITYGTQSALGSTSQSFSFGLNKDF